MAAFSVRRRRFALGLEILPEEGVRVIGNRNHVLPAVSAGEDVELVRDAELSQALVELLVRLREAIVVLLADIKVDLQARLLDGGGVRLGNVDRVDGTK